MTTIEELRNDYRDFTYEISRLVRMESDSTGVRQELILKLQSHRRTINQILTAYNKMMLEEGKSFKAFY